MVVRFSDVLTIVNGRNQKNVENKNGQYPIYGSGGIMGYADKYLCEADTVIIGRKGSINNPIYVKEPFWNVDTAFGLVADKTVLLPKYLYYFCVKFDFNALNTTVTIPSLTKANLLNIEMVLPTIEEQTIVVNSLDKIVNIIDMRKQQLQKLDELVKARFVEMFGNASNPKYGKVLLGSLGKLQGGYAFRSSDFVDDGIALVQISNVNKDYLNWEDVNKVPVNYKDKYSSFLLKEGDLLIAMTRPVIKSLNAVKVAKVSKDDLPCLLNQRVGRFICTGRLNSTYLEMVCKTADFKDYVERMSGNSLQPNVSSKQIEEYEIIMPPLELQNQFSDFVKQIDKSKLSVQKSLEKLEILKKALMQKYFG